MTNRTPYRLRMTALAGAAFAAAALAPSAALADTTVTIDCYAEYDEYGNPQDADGDGYAVEGATTTWVPVDEGKKLYCPPGHVRKEHDCDDTRASVHPNAPEIAYNLRDDDCDELDEFDQNGGVERVDEPELSYSPGGNQNTNTGFAIRVRLASWELALAASSLYYEIEYSDLALTGFPLRTTRRFVGTLPSDLSFDATLSGLAPTRVYRARLHFYKGTTSVGLVGGRKITRTSFTPIGQPSEWYYSTTNGDDATSKARTRILLQGFYQLSESERGRVGYLGTVKPDGTRYGAASKERWCSEFYVWLAKAELYGIGGASTVGGVTWWFASWASYHPGPDAVRTVARRADYLPMDLSPPGEPGHSTMFLAYDPTTNEVWTLEGNDGNYVHVRRRTLDVGFHGVGHVAFAQLIQNNLW